MKLLKTALTAMLLMGASGTTSPAYAQGAQCSCVTPALDGAAGQIDSASGKVLSSQPTGLGDAGAGTPIGMGTQIVTGANSSAQITIGTCSISIGSNTEMLITESGGNICVQTSEIAAPPPSNTLPVVLGLGAAAGGIAGIAAIGGGDESASQ